jgi:hypothetical protein
VDRLIVGMGLCFAMVLAPIAARADEPSATTVDPKDDALEHWKRGLDLYDEQDFANALIEFRKAYSIAPTYKVLYNIGQVCFQLTDYACALNNFQQYLRDGGNNIASDRRKEVEIDLEKLKTRVGSVEIVTNVAGADVLIDDVSVGKAPLASSIVVSAGRRKITVTKEGVGVATRVVEVAGTDSLRVELMLATPAAPAAREAPRVITPSRWTTLSFVGVGAAGALAIAGTVTGLLAIRASNDLGEERFVGSDPPSSFDSKSRSVKNLSLATDLLLGSAALTLGTTLVLTLTRSPKAERAPATVSLGVTPGGIVLQGAF